MYRCEFQREIHTRSYTRDQITDVAELSTKPRRHVGDTRMVLNKNKQWVIVRKYDNFYVIVIFADSRIIPRTTVCKFTKLHRRDRTYLQHDSGNCCRQGRGNDFYC